MKFGKQLAEQAAHLPPSLRDSVFKYRRLKQTVSEARARQLTALQDGKLVEPVEVVEQQPTMVQTKCDGQTGELVQAAVVEGEGEEVLCVKKEEVAKKALEGEREATKETMAEDAGDGRTAARKAEGVETGTKEKERQAKEEEYVTSFKLLLDKELERLGEVFDGVEAELVTRGHAASAAFHRLPCRQQKSGMRESVESVEYESLSVELVEVANLSKAVQRWVHLNREGLRKIIKKFSRRVGVDLTDFYLVKVGSARFCCSSVVTDVLAATTKLLSEMGHITVLPEAEELIAKAMPARHVFLHKHTSERHHPLARLAAAGDVKALEAYLRQLPAEKEPEAKEAAFAVHCSSLSGVLEEIWLGLLYAACKGCTAVLLAEAQRRGGLLAVLTALGHDGGTALHRAARSDRSETVAELFRGFGRLEAGVKEETVRQVLLSGMCDGLTPLHCAVRGGSLTSLRLILAAAHSVGSDELLRQVMEAREALGCTALLYCYIIPAEGKEKDEHRAFQGACAKRLLSAGADWEVCDGQGLRAVHLAAASGSVAALTALCQHVWDSRGEKKVKDMLCRPIKQNGASPLHLAHSLCIPVLARFGRATLFTLRDARGKTALHHAAASVTKDAEEAKAKCKVLLQFGIDANLQDLAGSAALHDVAVCVTEENMAACLDLARMLVVGGANPSIVNSEGLTCYDMAMLHGEVDLAGAMRRVAAKGSLDQHAVSAEALAVASVKELKALREQLARSLAQVEDEIGKRQSEVASEEQAQK